MIQIELFYDKNIMISMKPKILSFLLLPMLVACVDDAKKYTAEFPEFEPLEVKMTTGTNPKVGKAVVVAARQKKAGQHLYEVNYKWTVTGPGEAVQRYRKSAIYNENTPMPTDTITFSESGRYNVVMVASYEVAGVGKGQSFTENFPGRQGAAKYEGSALRYRVTLERTFDVED